MQVPLPLFSIYPGERAAELGDEVVAPRVVAVPPAAGDALGAGDERELGFFHRPNFVQEPCRPRAGLHELVRIPFARLDAAPGVLRAVIGIGGDAMDRVAPQTRLQALEELRPVLGLRRPVAQKPAASAAEPGEVARPARDGFDPPRGRRKGSPGGGSPTLAQNASSAPRTRIGRSWGGGRPPRPRHSAARAVGAVANQACSPSPAPPACSAASKAPRPPK